MSLAGDPQPVVSRGEEESGGCVHGGAMNSSPSAWLWALQHITVRSSTPAPRSQRTGTRAGEGEVFELRIAPRGQNTPHPEERPAPLLEVRPQVWAQRHSVVQVVGAVSELPTLDVPVPQLVDQLLSFLTALDSFVPEQVIEVPKIPTLSRCPRTVLSVPQTAEQLVEVPTIISYSCEVRISERIAEQTVFPSRDERISERIVEQTVFPSRYERISERIMEQTVFPSRYERSSERIVEQLVDIPVYSRGASSRRGPHDSVPAVPGQSSTAFGGGLQDFLPGQGFTAFSGAEHAHVAPRRSRRGGGPVGGPQHSVSGQSSTARGRARHRRFAGRLFILPDSRGCGFIESSAEAEFGDAAVGGFRVPVSWEGHFAADASVTFSVRTGPDGFMEAYDIEAVGRG